MSESSAEHQLSECLKEAPLPDRVPLLVLKKLLEERRALDRQRTEEVDTLQAKYRQLLKPIVQRCSEIVKGGPIKEDELKDKKYFNDAELKSYSKHMAGSKLDQYWPTALEANRKLEPLITDDDRSCLSGLQDVTCEVTKDKMSVTFEFVDTPFLLGGKYTRTLALENGQPFQSKGDQLKWRPGKSLLDKKKKGEESFFRFFSDSSIENEADSELLDIQAVVFSELVNDVVPYSLEYYLGIVDDDQDDDEEGFEEYEEDEDDEEDQPRKQHKP